MYCSGTYNSELGIKTGVLKGDFNFYTRAVTAISNLLNQRSFASAKWSYAEDSTPNGVKVEALIEKTNARSFWQACSGVFRKIVENIKAPKINEVPDIEPYHFWKNKDPPIQLYIYAA